MKPFVHLHNHTAYSLLDGAGRIEDEVIRAKALEMPALAITDHGVMYGAIEFYRACKKHGIKPIIGCEVYVAPRSLRLKESDKDASPYHLILLVKNEKGYRNLCKLVTTSSLEGFYYRPRIDWELLQQHYEGLIAMSACLGGEIPRHLMRDDYEKALETCRRYQQLFGEDFYLELQNHGLEEQLRVNEGLRRISRETGVKLVATNDNHYVDADGADVQDLMLCLQTGKTIDDPDRMRFHGREFYLKSYDEMLRMLPDDQEALDETVKIAEKCHFDFTLGHNFMPDFKTPHGESHREYLRTLCEANIEKRYGEATKEITERLDFELETIDKMGYNTYFLIVWDFINYAKQQGISVGPGRGSAAGSIVSYLLEITDIDPLKYQLLFERFLNPERVSMPDIDIDFCYERRGEVIDYVSKKYGEDHVSQIITFGTMLARGAVRDVGRVLNIPLPLVNKVCKLIPNELGITLDGAIQASEELRTLMAEDEVVDELVKRAKTLEGLPRNVGMHAAGVVISKEPIEYYMPLQRTKENAIITQYPKDDVEAAGLLKMDFLGLRTLTVLQNTIDSVKEKYGISLDFATIDVDDKPTYEMLSQGQSIGVFQLESSGLRAILRELKPSNLEDIIALVALYRPGPLGSGMVEDFIARKHGEQDITYLDPRLESILETTYGVILYQEQVMQIASSLAGFSLGEADMLRRAMGKKKPEIIANVKMQFMEGAEKNGTQPAIAQKIFELIEYFAGYGFNKSHSAAYGVLAFQTAYLKCHYPMEFMAETMNSFIDNIDKVTFYIDECRSLGIPVLPPDINSSGIKFLATDKGIRFGLGAIKGVGQASMEFIVEEREKGAFTSFQDFCSRLAFGNGMNKRTLENLIKCGAFDSLKQGGKSLLDILDECYAQAQQLFKIKNSNQVSLFDLMGEDQAQTIDVPLTNNEAFDHDERLQFEKELLGIYISGHPLDHYAEEIKQYSNCRISEITEQMDGVGVHLAGLLANIRTQTTRKGDLMAYATLEDMASRIDLLIFPKTLPKVRALLEENTICIVQGRLNVLEGETNDEKKLIVDAISPLTKKTVEVKSLDSKIYIKMAADLDYDEETVRRFLAEQVRGEVPVILFYTANKRGRLLEEAYWLKNDATVCEQLKQRFGSNNINIQL